MQEVETIEEFNGRPFDIANDIFVFGEKMCNPVKTLYSKILYKYAQFNEMKIFPYS